MPEEIIVELIGHVFDFAVEIAIRFWNDLLEWVFTSLATWIQTDFGPFLVDATKAAFFALTQVTTAAYNMIQKAWNALRQVLLEMVVEFHQSYASSRTWVRQMTTVLIKVLESGQPVILKREVEETINWDNLPPDVRATWLGSSQKNYKVDVLTTREKELQAMSMAH
jgi:hypothetical protein